MAVVTIALPYTPDAANLLGLQALPLKVIGALLLITLAYVLCAEGIKRSFYRAMKRPTQHPPPPDLAQVRLARKVREHRGGQVSGPRLARRSS